MSLTQMIDILYYNIGIFKYMYIYRSGKCSITVTILCLKKKKTLKTSTTYAGAKDNKKHFLSYRLKHKQYKARLANVT